MWPSMTLKVIINLYKIVSIMLAFNYNFDKILNNEYIKVKVDF